MSMAMPVPHCEDLRPEDLVSATGVPAELCQTCPRFQDRDCPDHVIQETRTQMSVVDFEQIRVNTELIEPQPGNTFEAGIAAAVNCVLSGEVRFRDPQLAHLHGQMRLMERADFPPLREDFSLQLRQAIPFLTHVDFVGSVSGSGTEAQRREQMIPYNADARRLAAALEKITASEVSARLS